MRLIRWVVLILVSIFFSGISQADQSALSPRPTLVRVKRRAHRAPRHKAHGATRHRAGRART